MPLRDNNSPSIEQGMPGAIPEPPPPQFPSHQDLEALIVIAACVIVAVALLLNRRKIAQVGRSLAAVIDRVAFAIGIDWRVVRDRWRRFNPR